jgi:hypothetical protein
MILAMAVVPVPALARGGGHGGSHGGFHGGHAFHGGHEFRGGHEFHGGHEFERHDARFEHFHGFGYPYPYYGCPYGVYALPCY